MVTLNITDCKIYVPAADFEESKRFYRDLGFELKEAWGGNVDCRLGTAQFRLQNFYVKDWAENFMMQFGVDDARAWHAHVEAMIQSGKYGKARVAEPKVVSDCLITHVWDPCGVLLIFIQYQGPSS